METKTIQQAENIDRQRLGSALFQAVMMSKTILIVDDEVSMTHMLNLIFKKKGYNVITTTDPHQVVSILDRTTPDLIILDYMMPGLNGVRLCEILRSRPQTRRTPIFMLSALNDLTVIHDCRVAGANDYFTKDEMATRLIQEVQRLVGASEVA
jgi:CheY-like chemotaxis protein